MNPLLSCCFSFFGVSSSGGPTGGPRGTASLSAPEGLAAPARRILCLFLLSLVFPRPFAALSVAVYSGAPLRAWGTFYPTECRTRGPPARGPQGPLAFLSVRGLLQQRECPTRAGSGGPPEGPTELSVAEGAPPSGPLPGGPQGASAAPSEGRLRPLFPELQTLPESTASSELSNTKFSEIAEIQPVTAQALEKRGIVYMTDIQLKSFDPIYSGRDVIGRSETGSGKTIAFVLPILERIAQRRAQGVQTPGMLQPQLLVLAPTRELARQVQSEVEALGGPLGLSSVCLYGGVALQQQVNLIREINRQRRNKRQEGIDVVVATPGRLMDFFGIGENAEKQEAPQNLIHLEAISHVVLDEADEMLKLGFAESVEAILSFVLNKPKDRLRTEDSSVFETRRKNTLNAQRQQLLLFSATQPPWVERVGRQYLQNPLLVDSMRNRKHRTASAVEHVSIEIPPSLSPSLLASAIQDCVLAFSRRERQSIVFVPTKADADAIAHTEEMARVSAAVLHGGIQQETREKVMDGFRKGRYKALICTDVAARGVDVANVDLVVHLGIAFDADVFVHRSGRTGRAGRRGISLLLHTPQERRELERLQRSCGIRFAPRELPSLEDVLNATSACISKQLDEVSPSLMPFFLSAASDILSRAETHGVDKRDVIARALAVAAGLKEMPSRSLLTLQPGVKTLELIREGRGWLNTQEVEGWLAEVLQQHKDNPNNSVVGPARQHATDGTRVYLDVWEGEVEKIKRAIQNSTRHLRGDKVVVSLPTKRPLLMPLGGPMRRWGPRPASGHLLHSERRGEGRRFSRGSTGFPSHLHPSQDRPRRQQAFRGYR